MIGTDVPLDAPRAHRRPPRADLARADRPARRRRVPLRDAAVPGSPLHVHARHHPRRRLRQPPERTPPRVCTRASSRPSRSSRPTVPASTSSGSRTTACAARCGRRRRAISARRRPGPSGAGPSRRRRPISSRPSSALDHLPAGAGTVEAAIDLRLGLRNALFALGQHERVFPHLAGGGAPGHRDRRRRTPGPRAPLPEHALPRRAATTRAPPSSASAACRPRRSTGDVDLEREARLGLALVHYPRGDCRQACESLERLAADLGDESPRPRLYGHHAVLGHHARLSRAAARRAGPVRRGASRPPRTRSGAPRRTSRATACPSPRGASGTRTSAAAISPWR